MQSALNNLEAERAELDAVLASGMLGRTNNLVRLLTFVCEKYFDGTIDEIKEYSIAVHALGRPENFDPQVDTIVRVTAHALRKRLEDYYRTGGAQHPIHICLPPGHYVPKFIHADDLAPAHSELNESHVQQPLDSGTLLENGFQSPGHHEAALSLPEQSLTDDALRVGKSEPRRRFVLTGRTVTISAAVVFAALALSGLGLYRWSRTGSQEGRVLAPVVVEPAGISGPIVRAAVGDGRAPYVDRSGATWSSDHFCSGGSSFSVAGHSIQGTEDSQLFSAGRRGAFHCNYPVAPGTYEVHLLFAETAGLLENARNVVFSINGGPVTNLDVVDDAGGDDIATIKVFTDVKRESDGTIHLDFSTPDSFLNAIEILPGIPHRMLPIRIMAGPSLYRDSKGETWMPDRYYFGGRVNRFGSELAKVPDGRLFEWHRYGHFHYAIPVATSAKYTLKLYFMEHWFGVQNGSTGGVGSRVFDVSCNGVMLLKSFDIFGESGTEPLVKTFSHIEPTAQGKIEIYFTPGLNYPSVSAVEVIPE
ncbi:MAG TPA: malectin domain-containing carbohydrate-binding protein [Candidatus Angelobacter sp.]